MLQFLSNLISVPLLCAILMACSVSEDANNADFQPVYNGIDRELLDVDLVNMRVTMTGARDQQDIVAYARCAVAQYALKRGYGFARHVRTNVSIEGGLWAADAVYTISPTLPKGLRTIDAEVTVQNCAVLGIPTV
ncbi:MAG: hypothetical protein ACU0C9_09965 [Paracoccaceae bacterium]